jgi:hypothetical protein
MQCFASIMMSNFSYVAWGDIVMNGLERILEFVLENFKLIIIALGALLILAFLLRFLLRHYLPYRICKQVGHDLDDQCLCRRCLMHFHDWEWVVDGYGTYEDPGALHLDSNFQPSTVTYEKGRHVVCRRCKHGNKKCDEFAD